MPSDRKSKDKKEKEKERTETEKDVADVPMEEEDEDDDTEEGGIRIGDIYLPPPPPPACTFDSTGPRLVITHIENNFFKSYAGRQVRLSSSYVSFCKKFFSRRFLEFQLSYICLIFM